MVDSKHSHTTPDTIILKCEGWDFAVLRARVQPHASFLAYFDSLHLDDWGRRWIHDPPDVVDCLLQYLFRSDYSLSKIVWPEVDADERSKEEGNVNEGRSGQVESSGLQERGEEYEGEEDKGDQMDVDESSDTVDQQEKSGDNNDDLGEFSIEDALKLHVELFLLGRRHHCPDLCDKASTKFDRLLNQQDWTIDQAMPAMRELWAKWPVTATLQKMVCRWLVPRASELTSNQTFSFEALGGKWSELLLGLVDEMYERLGSIQLVYRSEADVGEE